ncbi:uncharacterized protein LOC109841277 [Asparagus officinalis]|uniref:uncharacterized protein LOC109841277 n=1 Tax=Asparagus officinalis TaxID=4686 RepID=UPI00098E0498|nr:uncharacterized protein LOC109841277 [Asparagus officinalis]
MFEIPKADNGFILRKSSKTRREVEQMMTIPESMPEEAPTNSLGDDDFSNKDELSALKKGASLDFQPNFAFQNDVEQIKCQVQQLVDDVRIMKEEDLKKGKEQLKLLQKIYEQIKPVQSQIKNSKSKKSSQDEILIISLTEAMLSFSL